MSACEQPAFEDPRAVLRRHGLRPKRSFSQNFLVARPTVEAIARAPELDFDETVIEIGPGAGTLTAALLRRGAEVLAVERDRDMAALLREEFGTHPRFRLMEADAMKLDFVALRAEEGRDLCVVGNLPYAITGGLMRTLMRGRGAIREAVIMVQREVAARISAEAGSKTYGALSVFTQAGFAVEHLLSVSPGSFHPAPRVASAVIRLRPLTTPRAEESEAFRAVVKAAFSGRRKTLRKALAPLVSAGASARERVEAAGIDSGLRGEVLSVERFARLAHQFEDLFPRAAESGRVDT
jgi:16S rRNA (adenine1518-N6/adenine1519-N6)-dimethyltransferase